MPRILKKRRKLLLVNRLSPGDIVMMTAAVRDLHRARPNEYFTDVCTSAQELWDNNPNVTKLGWRMEGLGEQTEPESSKETIFLKHKFKIIKEDPELEIVELNYHGEYPASINRSNKSAYHFIHGFAQDLGQKLGVDVPITEFKGDIHISETEARWMSAIEEMGIRENFWIMMAGGKNDFTAKWWNPESYQKVVDAMQGKALFVQCGQESHFHKPLEGVINLIGKTNIRQFVRLMYHSEGVVCGVTFAMHLAAAVPMRPFDNKGQRRPPQRACVVVAGGREGTHWESYPHHRFLHTIGALPCCAHGGCWKSRCQTVGDGDPKDTENLCVAPVQIKKDLKIPKCMDLITPQQVVDNINMYLSNGLFSPLEKPVTIPVLESKKEEEVKVESKKASAKKLVPKKVEAKNLPSKKKNQTVRRSKIGKEGLQLAS
jgi:ADP-heptose:LPS heptosyltransferase